MTRAQLLDVGRKPEPESVPRQTVLVFDSDWRVGSNRMCRAARSRCGQMAVAELNRGYAQWPSWWAYCADHMYGRIILSDGVYWVGEQYGWMPDEARLEAEK